MAIGIPVYGNYAVYTPAYIIRSLSNPPPSADGTPFSKEGRGETALILALFSKEGGSAEPGDLSFAGLADS